MYDHCYHIYDGVATLIASLRMNWRLNEEIRVAFIKTRVDAYLHLQGDTYAYVMEVWSQAQELQRLGIAREREIDRSNGASTAERAVLEERVETVRRWFDKQHPVALKHFKRYLGTESLSEIFSRTVLPRLRVLRARIARLTPPTVVANA